jgi:acyl carrier protein
MSALENQIRRLICERLDLQIPDAFAMSAPLFAPQDVGGLELDSLASLEVIAALSDHYNLPMDDIEPSEVMSISALAKYLSDRGVPVNAS